MDPRQRRLIDDLYAAALAQAPEERTALLAAADPEVRSAVEYLLANRHDVPASPFDDETRALPSGVSSSRSALEPGGEIGAYRITGLLGAGGMGEVYRAHDSKLGRDVAIKTLPTDVRGDPDLLKRFRQEARMLAALNHPNIAAIHGLEESDAHVFLVLELVEGETLAARLARGGSTARPRRADHRRPGVRSPRSRSRAGHRAPRHQARQHQNHASRHRQGARLRACQSVVDEGR